MLDIINKNGDRYDSRESYPNLWDFAIAESAGAIIEGIASTGIEALNELRYTGGDPAPPVYEKDYSGLRAGLQWPLFRQPVHLLS